MALSTQKIKLLPHTLLLLLVIACAFKGVCQEVIVPSAPKYADGVYTKEGAPSLKTTDLTWENINTPVCFYNTTAAKNAQYKISYFKKYFSQAPLSFSECVYVNPANDQQFNLIHTILLADDKTVAPAHPNAFRFYADTVADPGALEPASDYLTLIKLKKPIEDFYQPYYFKKTEVTNKEYHQFVNWVLDSIARTLLAEDNEEDSVFYINGRYADKPLLNKELKIDWADPNVKEVLECLYLPPEERFYRRREIDPRRLNYRYEVNNVTQCTNVFPDTMVWHNDFPAQDILTNLYFWHIAFADYPVVGITQEQANAFLAWKTKLKQEELDRLHSNYMVRYELPDEMEWEMMAAKDKEHFYATEYTPFTDAGFETNLLFKADTSGNAYKNIRYNNCETGETRYKTSFPAGMKLRSDFVLKNYIDPLTKICLYRSNLTYTVKIPFLNTIRNASCDENGVLFMGGNVSEWMKDTYRDNWRDVYTMHQNKLRMINSPYSKFLLEQETLCNATDDTTGVLVRGANWYDLSFATTGSKNFEGMNKKKFVDPQKAYATVGFRYVIKIYRKDELYVLLKDLPAAPAEQKQKNH
ncbi:MAG: hypothetical protein JWP12_1629 [Bacteroidetes bacterium]|nr:hypothetical protein [Bacteroidota bacterium]